MDISNNRSVTASRPIGTYGPGAGDNRIETGSGSSARSKWFDHVFKGAPRPDLLKDKVNYEVTGANAWKHTSSLDMMTAAKRRVHLSVAKHEHAYKLNDQKDAHDASIDLKVDLADQSDADRKVPGGGVLDTELDTWERG